jgi:hypothetical protein
MALIILLIFIIIVLFVIAASSSSSATYEKARVKLIQSEIDSKINTTHSFIDKNLTSAIGISEADSQICLITFDKSIKQNGRDNSYNRQFISSTVLPFKDILSVELLEDGASITKTEKSSQIEGALIGGILFGTTGAIIGGLSGVTTSGTVSRIELRLTVNSMQNPSHELIFLDSVIFKKDERYKKVIDLAKRWNSMLDIVIKRAEN